MNRTRILLFLCLLPLCCIAAAQHAVTVEVDDVPSAKGKLMVALYNRAEGFPSGEGKAMLYKEVPAQKGRQTVVLGTLPGGTYALAVFHDANGDGELNTNVLGIPKEAYGFSNNARPGFRAPYFREAAFVLQQSLVVKVVLK